MGEQNNLIQELETMQAEVLQKLAAINSLAALQKWKSAYLGRSSLVMQVFKRLAQASPEERAAIGQFANQVKKRLEEGYERVEENLSQAALQTNLKEHRLDVSLPGRQPTRGRLHIQTQTLREIYRIFAEMGFQIYRSPDVESDAYNFELLNIPAHHPARDMWDTFFTRTESVVLRTHTSPGQIRAMRDFAPEPIRVVLPGMCYRYEQTDASHEFQFYQVELLAVGKGITFGDLKGTLQDFARRMFGQEVRTRFRPSYFPFVEPGGEMDVECFVCGGPGCSVCKQRGWLEILGCGMVHPVVLQNGGYDPREYSGFAAGMGPERISLLRYRINDIRNFWANDIRFLEQY